MTDGSGGRLDAELVRRGLARSRRRAAELIADGRVRVHGHPARKPAQGIRGDDPVEVDDVTEYVSRAAHKLIGALDSLEGLRSDGIALDGARCLDAGASTGGFTQVLLERGAAHVLALDVGHDQLATAVRHDPRVTVREGLNVRDLRPSDVGQPPHVVVADLSFISLTLVADALVAVAAPGADLLLMVKPQFEVGRDRLGSTGVVISTQLRVEAVLGVADACVRAGAAVLAVVPSVLPGESGNREYFLWVRTAGQGEGVAGAAPERGAQAPPKPRTGMRGAERSPADAPGGGLAAAVRTAVEEDRPVPVGGPA